MALLHIANTTFEDELSEEKTLPIEQIIAKHPIYCQLQFLPLLYAEAGDGIAVTDLPKDPVQFPLHLFRSPEPLPYKAVESWGYSRSIAAWAKKHGIAYEMPPWEVVKQVNSKEFSFSESPKLAGAALLHNFDEVRAWWSSVKGPKVLKSCYGLSGRGHLFDESRMQQFTNAEFAKNRPVIGEPWVQRDFDFSTQWYIHPSQEVEYLGPTVCVSDAKGQYRENRVGDAAQLFGKHLPLLEEHRVCALTLLKKIAALGFFGNAGVDAMIYEEGKLHPIVEVNARKTMGWVALRMQQKRFPKQTIAVSYMRTDGNENLLPNATVRADGSLFRFPKQLRINHISR